MAKESWDPKEYYENLSRPLNRLETFKFAIFQFLGKHWFMGNLEIQNLKMLLQGLFWYQKKADTPGINMKSSPDP